MSNTKLVHIEAEAPFSLLQDLSDTDAAMFARFFSGPYGLDLVWGNTERMVPNEHGGKTAMLPLGIVGTEAISHGALERVRDLLAKHGTVKVYNITDLDA